MANIVSVENITSKIFMIRGIKVMLDRDLAELYGVETKRLKEQVRRNISRFPEDFMVELSEDEEVLLRSQFATLKGKLKRIEEHLAEHNDQFRVVFEAIKQLLSEEENRVLIFMLGRFLLVAMEKGSSTPQGGIKKNLRLTLLG